MRQVLELMVAHHPAMFREQYPPRFVNNIYYDTCNLDHLFHHINGAAKRVKVRVRWYGDLFGYVGKPVLEYKQKVGLVGIKSGFDLSPFTFNKKFNFFDVASSIMSSDVMEGIKQDLKLLEPVLVNRFYRKYYLSVDKKFRLTIDYNITSYKTVSFNRDSGGPKNTFEYMVMELKYGQKEEASSHHVWNYFPFRLYKNSKYVRGMLGHRDLTGY